MEPRIQYAKTSDGVSIAFWSLGEGVPVIMTPPIPWSNLELEWRDPGYRAWYEANSQACQFIRYDNRGSGLSDHNVERMHRESFELDILAVADRLALDSFAVVGISPGGPVAISLAAHNPERVSHLVLWCSTWRSSEWRTPQIETLNGLIASDWTLYTETMAHAAVAGWGSGEEAHRWASFMRSSIEPETILRAEIFQWDYDMGEVAEQIRCPTLVLQRREAMIPTLESARQLAARIPDCELVVLDGGSLLPWVGDAEVATRAIARFLGTEAVAPGGPGRSAALATILFTDVEGSTALTQRLGDASAREVMREHERITREALRACGGSEVKTMGDGFMASFGSATRALECAVAIQREMGNAKWEMGQRVAVRCGLNAGEPIAEDDDLHGTAVIVAARIAALAEGGEILVSDVVRQLVAGKGFLFNDRGDHALKGFEDPVRVFEVRWRDTA